MNNSVIIGLLLVTLSGLGTGTLAWPVKRITNFHFGSFLLVYMLFAAIIIPWAFFLTSVPSPGTLIEQVGVRPLLTSNFLSIGWGIANVVYFICVIRIGAALTGALLSAFGMTCGALLPMFIKGSGSFSEAPDVFSDTGLIVLAGLTTLIAGVIIMSIAGFSREKLLKNKSAEIRKQQASGNFLQGLLLAILAGVLSSGLSLAFVYSQDPIIQAVKLQGGSDLTANFSVWALTMIGGGLINIIYALYILSKEKQAARAFSQLGVLYAVVIGFQFILSIVLLGKGMLLLGPLGASVGFAIQQSMQIIGNQMVGFLGGEWKGIFGKPKRLMYGAVVIMLIGVCILAYSN